MYKHDQRTVMTLGYRRYQNFVFSAICGNRTIVGLRLFVIRQCRDNLKGES